MNDVTVARIEHCAERLMDSFKDLSWASAMRWAKFFEVYLAARNELDSAEAIVAPREPVMVVDLLPARQHRRPRPRLS